MARDYENLHDLDDLSDRELRDLVIERLADDDGVDADNVTVVVEDGLVRLTGRVGSEEELRIAERVVSDGLGVTRYANELVVDALRRGEDPEAADDAAAAEADQDRYLGDRPDQQSDTADHLVEDLEAEMFGTRDVKDAIEGGQSYSPPDEPTPEGLPGSRGGTGESGEAH